MGTQLREQRKTIKQCIQRPLNTKGFTDRNLCSADLHNHSYHLGRVLETWLCGVFCTQQGLSHSPRHASLKGIWDPGCQAYNVLASQAGQSWWLPSGKIKPPRPVFTPCLALVHDNWKQRKQKMSELEGTRTFPVPARQHLVLALSLCTWQTQFPERTRDLPKVTKRALSRAKAIKFTSANSGPRWSHFLWEMWFLHPIWNSLPPLNVQWESPSSIPRHS